MPHSKSALSDLALRPQCFESFSFSIPLHFFFINSIISLSFSIFDLKFSHRAALVYPPCIHSPSKMDTNEDAPPEELPAPSGEQGDTDHFQPSLEVSLSQPVLFCDVNLSQRDVRNWSKKDAFRHFYVNWYVPHPPSDTLSKTDDNPGAKA